MIIAVTTAANEVGKRFRIEPAGDGSFRLAFEVENALAPHNWRQDGWVYLSCDQIKELLG
jgi:hypothetical protein